MSEPYQLFVFPDASLPIDTVIRQTHTILKDWGAALDADSMLYLEENGTEEPDPQEIENEEAALQTLVAWPALGSLSYGTPEMMISVGFKRVPNADAVAAVVLSMLQRTMDAGGEALFDRYRHLGRSLFASLRARRVVFDWGLEANGFDWAEEAARLASGRVEGSYALLDVSPDPT